MNQISTVTTTRKNLRICTNSLAKIQCVHSTILANIVNLSCSGAKITLVNANLNINDIFKIDFNFKNSTYSLKAKIVRVNTSECSYGIQFYFNNNTIPSRTSNTEYSLKYDILNEFSFKRIVI